MKTFALTSLLFAACVGTTDTNSTERAIIDTPCASSADCPTGFECEIEVEHGTTTSFCQADDANAQCPDGFELEVEHGQEFCKPHGGGGSGSGSGSGGGGGGGGASCTMDSDCPVGQECEIEIEHGQTTSTCKPHGGV